MVKNHDVQKVSTGHGCGSPGASVSAEEEHEKVAIGALKFDLPLRESGENAEHTRRLVEVADALPPVLVHRQTMTVIDGSHRVRAAQMRGERFVAVRFFNGTEAEAYLAAVEANVTHGLPLTLSERKAAALRLIELFPQRSNRMIALSSGLSDKTVSDLRSTAESPQLDVRTGADGRTRPLRAAPGRERAAEILRTKPGAPLREVARIAGISIGTAQDVRRRLARGDDPVPPGLQKGTATANRSTPRRLMCRISLRDPRAALEILKRDPAVRSSEAGRDLLRLLYSRSIDREQLNEWIDKVPAHCLDRVAGMADSCSEAWLKVARELLERERESLSRGRSDQTSSTA